MIELRTACGWKALVHKTLHCHYSTYYGAAICGGFREATSDHLNLVLNRTCAEWFVRWLYSGQLRSQHSGCHTDELFRLYIFADEKDILALRRAVMTRLMRQGLDHLPYCYIAIVTESLPPSAPLYKWAVG
jgi:hypothetical protein